MVKLVEYLTYKYEDIYYHGDENFTKYAPNSNDHRRKEDIIQIFAANLVARFNMIPILGGNFL